MRTIGRYFEPQQVTIRTGRTDQPYPTNVAVLHDGADFVAASDLVAVSERVDPEVGLASSDDLAAVSIPDVLQHIDDTTFTEFGTEGMIIASREIEQRAWQTGEGTPYAGFQDLSLLAAQVPVYASVAEAGIVTHVFGLPGWSVPAEMGVVPHGIDVVEIATFWFVVYDGGGDPERKCVLLAREVGDNRYTGLWTSRPDLVNRIGGYVYDTYIA